MLTLKTARLTHGSVAGFISSSWHITSHGMFAGSCIGVILLVMSLELFRRLSKEYDRYLLKQFKQKMSPFSSQGKTPAGAKLTTASTAVLDPADEGRSNRCTDAMAQLSTVYFRPNPVQQAIRALLHMITFAIAYFVMLLAMYYNGYFIICIFIGAYLGAFVFSWESIGLSTR